MLVRSPAQQSLAWQITLTVLNGIGWSGVAFAIIIGAYALLASVISPLIATIGLVAIIASVPIWRAMMRSVRRRRAIAVLGYLRQAIRLNLPVHQLLGAAAVGEKGKTRRRLTDLREAIELGATVSDGLGALLPELDARDVGQVWCAEQSGRLGDGIDRVVTDLRRRAAAAAVTPFQPGFWYPAALLVCVGGCVLFLSAFVLPKFATILQWHHHAQPHIPAVTRWVISAADWLPYVLPILLGLILIAAGGVFRETFTGKGSIGLLRPIRDAIVWYLPLIGGPVRDLALARACEVIAEAISAGFAFPVAIGRSTQLGVNDVLQRRLQHWQAAAEAGASPVESARASKIPKLLVGMLASARSDPASAVQFAGRFYQSRFDRRRAALRGILLPALTILIGILVAVVAMSVFHRRRLDRARRGRRPVGGRDHDRQHAAAGVPIVGRHPRRYRLGRSDAGRPIPESHAVGDANW